VFGFSSHKIWTLVHGMALGGILLLVFPAVLFGLWILRPEWVTRTGSKACVRLLAGGAWIVAVLAWLTDIIGSYVPYPWYRVRPEWLGLQGPVDLPQFPRSFLLASPNLAFWEDLGMEWKEHLGWIVPILATAVAYVVTVYGTKLTEEQNRDIRRSLIVLLFVAFGAACISGLLGALITMLAPVR
jgi:hypothetical protein